MIDSQSPVPLSSSDVATGSAASRRHEPVEVARPRPAAGVWFRQWLVRLLHGTKQLWRVNLSVPTQIAGQVVRIPILLGNGLQNLDIDSSEPWLMESLRRLFARRAGAFVDVGVNIG